MGYVKGSSWLIVYMIRITHNYVVTPYSTEKTFLYLTQKVYAGGVDGKQDFSEWHDNEDRMIYKMCSGEIKAMQ